MDGLVEVDGHRLAVHCRGSGRPTAVVLHGWIDQPGFTSHDYYGALTANLATASASAAMTAPRETPCAGW